MQTIRRPLLQAGLALTLIIGLSGCAIYRKAPPPAPGPEQLSRETVQTYYWDDDSGFKALPGALERSIGYYDRLPESYAFSYGSLSYSPKEMAASLRLFLDIRGKYKGEEFISKLREKFHFFESKGPEGDTLFTGYYEPMLEGRLEPDEEFQTPLYSRPDDLISVDLGRFRKAWRGETVYGRVDGSALVPYDSRNEIMYRASLDGRARPIAYVKEIELFFLQIQGSGLVELLDGTVKRVNYAAQNGHPYRSIGRLLRNRIPSESMSMQGLKAYLYAHPKEVRNILNYNPSYVFFREVEEGPLGNIEVPLTAGRSIAMDHKIIPRGGLAYIETDRPGFSDGRLESWVPLKRFVMVQDTGGAIRGHGRVDIFFGNGSEAELTAGHMKRRGRVFLIVAKKEFL